MKLLLVATSLLVLLGAGCSLIQTDAPMVTFDDCVSHGFPSNDALGQCRAHGKIYYKYGQSTTPTPTTTTTQW